MVRAPGAPPQAGRAELTLPEPTWGLLLRRGMPTFALEGILPVLLFYGLWRTAGLAPAAIATSGAGIAIVVWQRRRGFDTALAWATVVFLAIQAVVALVTDSATVYLAQPATWTGPSARSTSTPAPSSSDPTRPVRTA